MVSPDSLRQIGLRVVPSNRFETLYAFPDFDFLITLFNRAGFRNSEMFAPRFGEFHRLPYWGASPIVRGLADDKHFMKRIDQALGIPTPPLEVRPHRPATFLWDAGRRLVELQSVRRR